MLMLPFYVDNASFSALKSPAFSPLSDASMSNGSLSPGQAALLQELQNMDPNDPMTQVVQQQLQEGQEKERDFYEQNHKC